MRPAGFEIQAAVKIPTRAQLQLMADKIAGRAGFVAQSGRRPAIGVGSQPKHSVVKRGLQVGARRNLDQITVGVDIASSEGAVDAGRPIFETARPVQRIETAVIVVVGVFVAAGIVVFQG